ncbi:ras-like protein family member 12 isoform X2 [Anneissia japonica]|uniref:ras-like protein family member 12 isoform X2 n=1 Tax=Anneissia japonica TaxID=1529436 RepID=UPI00142596FB|nr:ras-like protein family member 12 isoform X2 [Anneissia japonica]
MDACFWTHDMTSRSKMRTTSSSSLATLPEFKIALLGCLGVGKSALTVKFITKRFINEYDPTLDSYTKKDSVDNQVVLITLLDTVFQETRDIERYLDWSDGLMVVYSITSKQSFDEAKQLLHDVSELQKNNGESTEIPVALIGNKNEMERYRQVSKDEGTILATQYACSYHEVSAAGDFEDVEIVLHKMVREIKRETERHMPIKPLFISEDKLLLPPATTSGKERGDRSKSPTPKPPKVVQKKTVTSFKIFNKKGFKIF